MNTTSQPIATLLVGAEGVAETDGQPWVREATDEEKSIFIAGSCKGNQQLFKDSLVDRTGRPYFLLAVLENAPEEIQVKARR